MSLNFYFGYKLSLDFGKSPIFAHGTKMCTDTGILRHKDGYSAVT